MIGPYPITDDEHRGRISAVQTTARDHGLAAIIAYGAHRDYQPADLRYLARWFCIDEETACLFVPADGPTTLLTDAAWDVERAGAEAFTDAVRHAPDFGPALAALVRSAGGPHARVGISGYRFFPAPAFAVLSGELPDAVLEDASTLLSDLRMVKSPAELALLREASRISDAAMTAGLRAIAEGRAEYEVVAAAEHVIRSAGAELAFTTVMGAGPRTALATFLPGDHRLARGELAVLDCGARLHGYHGDMCRTVVVGGPNAEERAMLEAVAHAVEAAIQAARPEVTVAAVRDAAASAIAEAGFGAYWWDAFMPHGAGAGQHEPPNAHDNPDLPLREGMVLCIEPGIMVPGKGGIVVEQMIAVARSGAEVLNQLPLDMWDRL